MSAEPLTRDGAWFVGIKADGDLDREWPADCEGRSGTAAVMGNSAKIIKVVPARTARLLIEAVEAERDALARRVEALRVLVDRIAQDKWTVWQGPAKRAIAADDEAAA